MDLKTFFLVSLGIIIKIFILKICLGSFDVISDFVKGFNFFNGEFTLAIYFSSKTRAEFDEV